MQTQTKFNNILTSNKVQVYVLKIMLRVIKLLPIYNKIMQAKLEMACVDLTDVEYYGKSEKSEKEIRCSQRKNGTNKFHTYATTYLNINGQRYTLVMTYVLAGECMRTVIERLYRRLVLHYGLKPELWLLDRGFYSSFILVYSA